MCVPASYRGLYHLYCSGACCLKQCFPLRGGACCLKQCFLPLAVPTSMSPMVCAASTGLTMSIVAVLVASSNAPCYSIAAVLVASSNAIRYYYSSAAKHFLCLPSRSGPLLCGLAPMVCATSTGLTTFTAAVLVASSNATRC